MNKIWNNDITAVIHQPYFIPWMGYFSKLVYADKFIVLDNVNYSARHYLDRARIINSQGNLMWIKLPIGEPIGKKINEIHFSDINTVKLFIKNIYSSYSKARCFRENVAYIESILLDAFSISDILSEINIYIIVKMMELLNLDVPEIIRSSQFRVIDDATDRIIMLCEETQCNVLITGSGGLNKHDWERVSYNGITTYIQYFFEEHPVYYQTRRTQLDFAKGLSVIDCIFNTGIENTKLLLCCEKYKPIIL